ncbi:DNA polymerase III subunit alpha [uncultured Parvimonas sp.]|uniref:DNA polymerase III subunit alpha n=1 Tax=uncultured Parvimonas sp. TaxID=747372 RepID=UPI0028D8DB93|nr:DNA polymerase III subunit alpha [uncultured Parvimonas sp.]
MANDFVHLNVHTEYSLLNNYNPMEKLIDKAKELNFKAMAITDYNNMYGVVDFYKRCKKNSIKPIIGCELTLSYPNNEFYNIILLAKNNQGYKNLCKLVSNLYVIENRNREYITFDELEKFSKNLILIVGSKRSFIRKCLYLDDTLNAKNEIVNFKSIFNKEDLFLELNFHFEENDELMINKYLELANEVNVETVVTNDVHYLENTDFNLFNIARCISKGILLSELKEDTFTQAEYYLKSEEEMLKIFSQLKDSMYNTKMIAQRCNVEFDFSKYHLPEYKVPDGVSTKEDYLHSIIIEGMKKRYENITDEIKKRVNYEFSVINKMGFTDYFLIVWDFVNFAKKNKIPVGPGRGSGANSIVAYCLEITDIDPIEYELIFERFLNPERISMPDFDIDFCNERREEVIDYVIRKYGKNHVSQIVTFGTMKPRAAVRDIGRVLGYKLSTVDKVAKLIPNNLDVTFKNALKDSLELKKLYDEDVNIKKLINTSEKFEKFHRHISIHAAGIVITKEELTEYVPLSKSGDNIVTQFNMIELEELGLLKMDFLGLRTLTVIDDTIRLIKKNYNREIDIEKISLSDKNVLNLFKTADTIGIFQFESTGMRLFLKDLKADNFDELVAANSLFRPGPMNQIPNYIKNKNNPNSIRYLDKRLEKYLKSTYGIIVYQEQVMQIARELAGYTWGQADNLRKAIGKKHMDIMEYNRKIFIYGLDDLDGSIKIKGCVRNGVDEKLAQNIFDLIVEFGNYAFNKSHSACYSLNAYRTAYLKYYYPLEYMVSLLNSVINYERQFFQYFQEIKRMGIKILLPSVNYSHYKISTENKCMRIGFSQIKGFNRLLAKDIEEERKNGEFKSFKEFLERLKNSKNMSLQSIENLVKSGAFDEIEEKRIEILNSLETLFTQIVSKSKNELSGQLSLISSDFMHEKYVKSEKFLKDDLLEYEKDVLGFYISSHPLDEYKEYIKSKNSMKLIDLKVLDKGIYNVIVYINSIKLRRNKKNKMLKTINVEDFTSSIEILDVKDLDIIKGKIYEISIKVSINSFGNTNFTVIDAREVDSIYSKKLYIKIENFDNNIKKKLSEFSEKYGGINNVILYITSNHKTLRLENKFDLKNENLIVELENIFGKDCFRIN